MARRSEFSEYDLKGTEDTGVYPSGPEALTPGDRQRLFYLTGDPDDPAAPIDEALFHGVESAEDRTEFFKVHEIDEPDPESEVNLP